MRIPSFFTSRELALVMLIVGGCASDPSPMSSLPGTTTANPLLERDTVKLLLGMDRLEDCTCNQRKIINRKVSASDTTKSSEHWTVDRCGTLVRYRITYLQGPGGGTLISLDPSPVVVQKAPEKEILPLPREFEDVWYRAGDRGLSLKAYSASGKLIISEQLITFGENSDAFEIVVSEIKSVCWGKMTKDTYNEWVKVRYGSPEKIVGFKDGSRLGWGTGTPLIMSTLSSALKKRSTQQTR